MNFEQKLRFYTDAINTELDKISAVPENLQKDIYEAMRYSLLAGGKRIRPILTLAVCEMLGGDLNDAMVFASAIECIHTYSLIHDDLPCMDNDDLRRGNPTCHKAFGESTALLAGDGLLTYAFERMANYNNFKSVSEKTALRIIFEIATGAGCSGMIGGQVVDLLNEGSDSVSEETLSYMHLRKTGALIRISALAGALVGGATDEEIKRICDFANGIGLAFQIKDDILDFVADENVLGKHVGSDLENHKTTYVTLLGIEAAQKKLIEVTSCATDKLEIFGEKADFLRELAGYLTIRNM